MYVYGVYASYKTFTANTFITNLVNVGWRFSSGKSPNYSSIHAGHLAEIGGFWGASPCNHH
jgi:hypothetical protein